VAAAIRARPAAVAILVAVADILRAAVEVVIPAVAATPPVVIANPENCQVRIERVAVNEVKTEARRGVLNGTPFFNAQGFKLSEV
jgi:hypothetical protein